MGEENQLKKTGRTVGILFLTLMVAYSIGAFVLIDPILNTPDYLANVAENKTQVIVGVLLELINGIAYLGIAVLVFPLLKAQSESLALGYFGFRILEFAMQLVSDLSPLLLISVSQEFVVGAGSDPASLKSLGTFLLAQRFWANQMVFITYGLGALIFYYWLYRSRLIPRFLSVWGLIGAPLVLFSVLWEIFGFDPILILGFIMGLNELVLGILLIVKGFNTSAVKPESLK